MQAQRLNLPQQKDALKGGISFIVLFLLYHGAEYMMVAQNNALGFLGGQVLFFFVAWLLGNWCRKNGLAAWGLPFAKKVFPLILTGILLGVVLYAVPYFVSLVFGIEHIVKVPDWATIVTASLPFAFGVLFSSFSEDVLTRGMVYTFLHKKVPVYALVLVSATVYVLNHIYRLGDGADVSLYLFLLGIVYIIPVMYTRSLWLTGSMHWAGNVFFFVSHNVVQTEEAHPFFSANYLFATWLVLSIPLVWLLGKRMTAPMKLQAG